MGQTKYLSPFEQGIVVGARHTGLSVSRTATLLGFSLSTVSCVYQEWSSTQRTSIKLDTTVGSIGVDIEAVLREKRDAAQYWEGVPNVLYTQCRTMGCLMSRLTRIILQDFLKSFMEDL